jgi:hypothetical protein
MAPVRLIVKRSHVGRHHDAAAVVVLQHKLGSSISVDVARLSLQTAEMLG